MPLLYLVRHAEPVLAGVLLGRLDPPLSAAGRAAAAAIPLPAEVAVLYASPLARTRETAALAAHGREVIVLPELVEVSLGEWDGLPWSRIEQRWPELAAAKLERWLAVTPPGGESWEQAQARVEQALARIRGGNRPAAVIGHVGINAEIARQVAGIDPLGFRQNYCEVSAYDFAYGPPDGGAHFPLAGPKTRR